jgi:small subunit ribosomal protein S1
MELPTPCVARLEADQITEETLSPMTLNDNEQPAEVTAQAPEAVEEATAEVIEAAAGAADPAEAASTTTTEAIDAPEVPTTVPEVTPDTVAADGAAPDAVVAELAGAPGIASAPVDVAPGSAPIGSVGEAVGSDGSVEQKDDSAVAPSSSGPAEGESPVVAEPSKPAPKVIAGDRPAITAPTDLGDVPDDMSADDFAAVVERTVFEFKEGDIVAGHVVRVDPDEVLVDIGYKSEGVIPAQELSIRNNANPAEVVTVGEPIEALVMQMEDDNGRLVLSKKRAQYERAWGRIERVMNEGGTVSGPVIEVVKGGLIVDIGLRGFLPASLVDLRRVRDLNPFVGEAIEAKVIELDKNRNNVVLSRRAFLEEAQAEQRQEFLSDLQPGDVREGVVSSVVNFGAFVDLGGMDGLVHVSELSWQHVSHPGEVVSVGDKVMIRVLEVDRDRERISLSIRQTREDPWDEFARDIDSGGIIDGVVTKTVPFGAFVSVGEGVEGLVHVSEIAMHHVESPELELSIGQQVRVKVTEIDADRRRVSLSIKQALPEWEERSTWSDKPAKESRPKRREFTREEDATPEPSFNADSSLEAILQELKERGIGRG